MTGDLVIAGTGGEYLNSLIECKKKEFAADMYNRSVAYEDRTIEMARRINGIKETDRKPIRVRIKNEQKLIAKQEKALQRAIKAKDEKAQGVARAAIKESQEIIKGSQEELKIAGSANPKVLKIAAQAESYNRSIMEARNLLSMSDPNLATYLGEYTASRDKLEGSEETRTALASQSMFGGLTGIAA